MNSAVSELANRVDAFEDARARDPNADIATFLPSPDHPDYVAIAAELIRVDLDYGWTGNHPRPLAEYQRRFPVAFRVKAVLEGVAYEEYRLRRRAGQRVSADEYRVAYGVDVSRWPAGPVNDASESGTQQFVIEPVVAGDRAPVAERTPIALTPPPRHRENDAAPEIGDEFLGFHLIEELGRGAFGRVYLARQGALAGRPVAVKIARDIFDESQTLAQLQHTNIVPIYSFHRAGPLQAVCMPYFGRTTLARVVKHLSNRPSLPSSGRELKSTVNLAPASTKNGAESDLSASSARTDSVRISVTSAGGDADVPAADVSEVWSRLDGLTYVDAVLWMGGQLADGLGHAHDRGILHRDLKPANVLLTDEGRPMLLDFNLAENIKNRDPAERAVMGGTLPYMAPEQIDVFRARSGTIDGRADLFALGVILFELLTGRHPYPARSGPAPRVMSEMLADRRQPPSVPGVQPGRAAGRGSHRPQVPRPPNQPTGISRPRNSAKT
ncbi:serine/threonine-protein kinase [Fimbriiglobus ruber]|uniref:Serine/threonine protein kinase PrkC, regulator of stationary phase n=1 Tax=Fimbriiglobus ruber TaxID=1908690 RepID=A0A225DI10_9BACT|nr:serine/threonine-protein kinase [Fimbriiglobus ruber]OWK36829.1 Serine/threonine protein kinase PrkC, regulator of stationary phase [Fimbriiglobus ruber]